MNNEKIIKMLQKADTLGEAHVRLGGLDVIEPETEPEVAA